MEETIQKHHFYQCLKHAQENRIFAEAMAFHNPLLAHIGLVPLLCQELSDSSIGYSRSEDKSHSTTD